MSLTDLEKHQLRVMISPNDAGIVAAMERVASLSDAEARAEIAQFKASQIEQLNQQKDNLQQQIDANNDRMTALNSQIALLQQ